MSGSETKVVILAGGLGTRIMEESYLRPKPMVEIGGRPILWHIMKLYGQYGFRDFIICLGYKGYVIKEYFVNFFLHQSDVTIDTMANKITYHQTSSEPWRVTLVDTGETTLTGGRLKRVRSYLDADAPFCFTYGDGVADIDMNALVAFHRGSGRLATVTAVMPPGRYGALDLQEDRVVRFAEKPQTEDGFINGGFFVLNPAVIDRIEGDQTSWESHTLGQLAADRELAAYRHRGFWHAMDTLRDKNFLEELWQSGRSPWKVWN
ncbi:MAG: glucose-1-phosphate cytidylyltransferase [Xanthobacteraceae bacterium]|jgi:glucose-1-phosphate cytidylyltransferase